MLLLSQCIAKHRNISYFSMFNESTKLIMLIVIIYTNKNCVYNGKIDSDTPKFLHVLVMVQIYIAALLAF